MSDCSIMVNGVKYVPETQPNSPIKIAILQRGWVMVGYFERDGSNCVLTKASVIRTWGTTKGLGEIALNGPTKNTVLDPTGRVEFDVLTGIAFVDCEESKWASKLL